MSNQILLATDDQFERTLLRREIKSRATSTQIIEARCARTLIAQCRTRHFNAIVLGKMNVNVLGMVRFIRSQKLVDLATQFIIVTPDHAVMNAACKLPNTFFVDRESPNQTAEHIVQQMSGGRRYRVVVTPAWPRSRTASLCAALGPRFLVEIRDSPALTTELQDFDVIILAPGCCVSSDSWHVAPPRTSIIAYSDDPTEAEAMLLRGAAAVLRFNSTDEDLARSIECVMQEQSCEAVARRGKEAEERIHTIALHAHAAQHTLSRGLASIAREHLATAVSNCEGYHPSDDDLFNLIATPNGEDTPTTHTESCTPPASSAPTASGSESAA